MELSRKRIDDAPEIDVHSSRFVTVTDARVCASAWANVHHTLVSVCSGTRGDFDRNDGTFDDIPQLPDGAQQSYS
jgi:hypothetical protein